MSDARFTWEDDPAQHEPFVICTACDKKLCTIEEGDTLTMIVDVVDDHHLRECEKDERVA